MKIVMKLFIFTGLLASIVSITGCSYGQVVTVGKDYVVVLRQDGFLLGALRKAYVCKATSNGLSNCQDSENP